MALLFLSSCTQITGRKREEATATMNEKQKASAQREYYYKCENVHFPYVQLVCEWVCVCDRSIVAVDNLISLRNCQHCLYITHIQYTALLYARAHRPKTIKQNNNVTVGTSTHKNATHYTQIEYEKARNIIIKIGHHFVFMLRF